MKLIAKDVVIAEIEKKRDAALTRQRNLEAIGQVTVLNETLARELDRIISFINTLEVKEVDLEKEIELVKGDYEQVDVAWNNDFDFIAKHFFELGLKVQKGI